MNSSLYLLIGFIGVILVVELANNLVDHSLNALGIVPRTLSGLPGILLSPFLHGGYPHVQSNAVGLLSLGTLAVIQSGTRFPWVCLTIILAGGTGLWVFGRPATHVGASGLVFGLFGYLLVKGILDRSILSVLVAIVVAGVFGWAMLSGLLPTNDYVSWEGHLTGLLAGILAAILTRGRKSPRKPERSPITDLPGMV